MYRRMLLSKIGRLVMLVALLASALFNGPIGTAAVAPDAVTLRVATADYPALLATGVVPVLDLDYGSFHWLELAGSDYARIQMNGIAHELVLDSGQIQVLGYRFNPLKAGEPKLPAGMQAIEGGSQSGLRLVQLMGPVKDQWLKDLGAVGLEILQYYPHNTYLVWANYQQANQAEDLSMVRWTGLFHPAYKVNADLQGRTGQVNNVAVMFYNDGDIAATLAAFNSLGAKILQYYPAQPDLKFYEAILEVDAGAVDQMANLPTVWWLGYASPEPVLDDEMSSQILAGNYAAGVPFTGYNAWLAGLGYDGSGVTWAIVDTGVDYDHPDLGPHIVGGYDFPGACSFPGQPGSDCSGGGHGTHVAGIVGGDASAGFADGNGFLYGLGVAPGYGIFAMNSLSASAWPPTGGWQEHSKRAVLGGAIGGNNSWTTGEGTAHGYQSSERTHDLIVRDGNFDTAAVAEPFIEVFSAGNSGPGALTLTAPKEAKNLIIIASSQNYRIGSIDTISSFSSRGPAVDGRYVPTVTTPGEQIASSRNDLGGSCSTAIAGTNNLYAYCSGTSMAAPHASGAVALITEWWRTFNAGNDPSPAMAKALLVNGAVDMGAADIPNFNEGWGRVYLPGVIDTGVETIYYDQTSLFQNTGETWSISFGVADPTKPLKVTLAWSDAPGAVGANPALVNNLDLSVENGGNTYLGNRFSSGWSVTGGSPDLINNLENVYIQNPSGGATITIQATNIAGDGVPYNGDTTDQDFALVCYNCALFPDFTLGVDPTSQEICSPDNATFDVHVGQILGYDDPVTLSANGNPAGTTVNFSTNPVTPPGSSVLTIGNTGAASFGSYDINVVGVAPTSTHTATIGLSVYTGLPSGISLSSPVNGALNVAARPTFSWGAGTQAQRYTIEIATDSGFSNIVAGGLVEEASYTPDSDLNTSQQYYWRVRAANACGDGSYSATWSFTTEAAPGDCGPGTLPMVVWSDDFESGAVGWTHSGTGDTWALSTVRQYGGSYAYHATDPTTVSDQRLVSPAVVLPAGSLGLTLQYWNQQTIEDRSATECYDGGLLEISTDGGGNWVQVAGSELLTDPYDGTVNASTNPLNGKQAWCGDPQDWVESVVDLEAYAGQTVQFRFRLGSDSSVGREGWYLDEMVVQSCVPAGYNFNFGPDSELQDIGPGSSVVHEMTLVNLGLADSYSLTLETGSWAARLLTANPVVVGAGGVATVEVEVEVPDMEGTDVFTVTAQSQMNPGLDEQTASGTTHARIVGGVELSPASQTQSGAPGETVGFVVEVENTGNYTDTIDLGLSGHSWPTGGIPGSVMLGAGARASMTVTVAIPSTPAVAEVILATDEFTLEARSRNDSGQMDSLQGTTHANVEPGVSLEPGGTNEPGEPGTTVTHSYTVENTGDYTDTYAVSLSGYSWGTSGPGSVGPLGPGEQATLEIEVAVPVSFPPLTDEFRVQVTSGLDSDVKGSATGTTEVDVNPGIDLGPASQEQSGLPGSTVVYTYTLENTGDYTDTYDLVLKGAQWGTSVAASVGPVAPGEQAEVVVRVNVPVFERELGNDDFTLTGSSRIDAAVKMVVSGLTRAVVNPGVEIDPLTQSKTGAPGEQVSYTFEVTNAGDYRDSFSVALSGHSWATSGPVLVGPLNPGEMAEVVVEVRIPDSPALEGVIIASDEFTLTVSSRLDAGISLSGSGTTHAGVNPGVSLSENQAGKGQIGTQVVYTFTVENTGDYADSFALASSGAWGASLSASGTGELQPGEQYSVVLTVAVPTSAADQGLGVISLTATSGLDNGVTAVATASTTAEWLRTFLSMILR